MDSKTSQEASSGSRGPRKLRCTHCTERHWKCRRMTSYKYLTVACPGLPTEDDMSLPSPARAARSREPGKKIVGPPPSSTSARTGDENTDTTLPRTADTDCSGSSRKYRTLRPKGPFVTSRFQLLGPGGDEKCATADGPKIDARQLPTRETEVSFPEGPPASKRQRHAEVSIHTESPPSPALATSVLVSVDTVPETCQKAWFSCVPKFPARIPLLPPRSLGASTPTLGLTTVVGLGGHLTRPTLPPR